MNGVTSCQEMKCRPGMGMRRRDLLKGLPLLALSPRLLAQQAQPIRLLKQHNFGLRVADLSRSVEFYQGLFGSPVLARQGDTVVLRLGEGPYCYSIRPLRAGEQPGITHIGLSVADFDLDRINSLLAAHGLAGSEAPTQSGPNLQVANQRWIRVRGPQEGGAAGGTRELFFADRDGIYYQLNSQDYCGGGGPYGSSCGAPEAAPGPGLIRLRELSHFTNFVHNSDMSNAFHRRLFGLEFQAYQGPTSPVIGVGDGIQFLMYVGGQADGQPAQPGRIDHVCMGMDDFDVERVLALLDNYGLSARENAGDSAPLQHWISLRMPNRGGAEGGTPELYFSDPDGIRIQLQDPGYCGGTGYLGDDCSNPA